MAEKSCEMYGYKPNPQLHEIFTKYHKTHNQGVFDIYTPEMLKARHNKILTGLPDTYGRGRIVGDYRRVALYGIDYLIEKKKADFTATNRQGMKWHSPMDMIFPSRLRMQKKQFSGCTSDIWLPSRHRTVQL